MGMSPMSVARAGFGRPSTVEVCVGGGACGLEGPKGVESWARPALMAIEVWMQRRNGELWRTTSYLLRFRFAEGSVLRPAASSSS